MTSWLIDLFDTPDSAATKTGWWVAILGLTASPFLCVLVALALARPAGLIWWTAAVYTVLAGAFGVWVDVDIITLEDPLAGLGLYFLALAQWIVLVPTALIVGLIVVIRAVRRAPAVPTDDRETRRVPTGK